jgi:hypothetical protein
LFDSSHLPDVPTPPVGFEAAFGDLDPEERASFVAAVYDARGWESERVGTVVSVRQPAGGTDPRRVAPPGVTASDDVRTLPLDDLREMLRYAVPPTDRSRLYDRFFDESLDAVESVGPTETSDEGGRDAGEPDGRRSAHVDPPDESSKDSGAEDAPDRPVEGSDDAPNDGGSGRRTLAALPSRSVVAVALVVACGIVAAPFALAVVPIGDSPGSVSVDETPGVGNASADTETPSEPDGAATGSDPSTTDDDQIEDSATGRQIVLETSYPPGVGVDGVENASALAAAHRATLSNGSYRLSVTNRESVDGRRTAVAWERTTVEAPDRYRSTVRVAGAFRWPPTGVANASTYANGTKRVVRVGPTTDADGTVRFESPVERNQSVSDPDYRVAGPASDTDPFAVRTVSLLERALLGADTTVTGTFERDGLAYFWIEIRNASSTSGADKGTLLVDERGLVHEIRYARTVISLDSVPVRRTVTVRVTPGNVTLVSPPWYRPADADERRSGVIHDGSTRSR